MYGMKFFGEFLIHNDINILRRSAASVSYVQKKQDWVVIPSK